MRNLRTVLSLPLVGIFYGLIYLTGFVAWLANGIAGHDGIVKYRAENMADDSEIIDVEGGWK